MTSSMLDTSTKKLLIAIVLSLPWLPFILVPAETISQDISLQDMLLATPLVLEFFGFYMLHGLTEHRAGVYDKNQQKYLLVLVVCLFGLFAVPVAIMTLTGTDSLSFKFSVVLGLCYALYSLYINTQRIRESSTKIRSYFARRYLLPMLIAAGLFLALRLGTNLPVVINVLAAYFIIKNIVFAASKEKA